MLSINLEQAQRHIEFLHGDADQPVCFQSFFDDKTGAVDTLKQPATFHAKLDDSEEYFNQVQAHNYGVYCTLNKTDGKGREEHNIIGYSTLFADFDDTEIPKLPLQPHMITQRDSTHSHCFWKVKGIVTDDQFKRYQKQLAIYLGSDEQTNDPSRVLRLAGTYNLKDPANPAMYKIKTDYAKLVGRDHAYSLEDINNKFALQGEDLARLDQWCDSRNSLDTGAGFNDDPIYHEQLAEFASRAEPAIEGSGTMTLIKVASFGYDHGVRLEECQQIMWEVYNPRCLPPWEEHEHKHFNQVIERAYKYANNAAGCKTAVGKFSALRAVDPLPEPVGGWEADAERGRLARQGIKKKEPALDCIIEEKDLIKNDTDLTDAEIQYKLGTMHLEVKSNGAILDMARMFILANYPNGNIIRTQKIFYEYNGKCYQPISDDGVKSKIMFYFSTIKEWKLAPSKITNIYATVEQMAHNEDVLFDSWLDVK